MWILWIMLLHHVKTKSGKVHFSRVYIQADSSKHSLINMGPIWKIRYKFESKIKACLKYLK
jgi:hypothetical protein